jgi:hypothetical protein
MAECARCGSTDFSPGERPWWINRLGARLFRVARCRGCGEYVHALTGERIAPLYWRTTFRGAFGALFIPAVTAVGPALGGRPGWWFAGSLAAWVAALVLTLVRIARRGR